MPSRLNDADLKSVHIEGGLAASERNAGERRDCELDERELEREGGEERATDERERRERVA